MKRKRERMRMRMKTKMRMKMKMRMSNEGARELISQLVIVRSCLW